MFDYIKIEGFRSFKKVELNLSPLSVLIGPNNGGKSNFLDLLSLMVEARQGHLSDGIASRGGFRDVAFGFNSLERVQLGFRFTEEGLGYIGLTRPLPFPSRVEQPQKPDIRFEFDLRSIPGFAVGREELWQVPPREGSTVFPVVSPLVKRDSNGCEFLLESGPGLRIKEQKVLEVASELAIFQVRDLGKYPTAYRVLRQFQEWTVYRPLDTGPYSPVRQPALLRSGTQLSENGANLSSVLHSIQSEHPAVWEELGELLHTAYSDFCTITVQAKGGDGKVLLRWFERPYENEGISANLLSDGTLKLLCLIAILKNPDPPPLICIDEPELGLHPDWIKLVAELLQDAAMRTQVIVATHSPHIVAKLDPEQVIVAEKVDGETRLTQLKTPDLENFLKDFSLADLWLSGELGGRP